MGCSGDARFCVSTLGRMRLGNPKTKNAGFLVLVLHSPFTIFVKKNGGGGVTKWEILRNKGIRKQF